MDKDNENYYHRSVFGAPKWTAKEKAKIQLEACLQVALGVRAMHERGVIHGFVFVFFFFVFLIFFCC